MLPRTSVQTLLTKGLIELEKSLVDLYIKLISLDIFFQFKMHRGRQAFPYATNLATIGNAT